MLKSFRALDRILRGETTQLSALKHKPLDIPLRGLLGVILFLGAFYGICMGFYAVFKVEGPTPMQMFASAAKVPLLFLLTLMVTFPSLYVFNALVGSRLTLVPLLRLLIASLGIILAVLASLGPIVAFFSVSTTSYVFMVLLNVLVFSVAGCLGLAFLLQTLHRLTLARQADPQIVSPPEETGQEQPPPPPPDAETPSALDAVDGQVLGAHVK
jgi:hypothetical protein